MKSLLFTLTIVILLGCEKKPVNIVYGPPTNLSDQKVLIEEFTGFQCTFCPQGSDEIESLIALNQGNVIGISIHSGFFAKPGPKNKFDFRTPDGDELYNILGAGAFYPAASINRFNFSGQGLINSQGSWAGSIQQLLSKPAKASLKIETEFDIASRSLKININGVAKESFQEKLLLHIMITESNIIDFQKDYRVQPSGEVLDYVHKHVFRDAITSVLGDDFVTNPVQGQVFNKEYNINMPDTWVAKNCNVIAFISYSSTNDIIQVNEAKVIE